jgi:hypothetical protein
MKSIKLLGNMHLILGAWEAEVRRIIISGYPG